MTTESQFVAEQLERVPTAAGAVDLVQMIKCLRYLADELDRKLGVQR